MRGGRGGSGREPCTGEEAACRSQTQLCVISQPPGRQSDGEGSASQLIPGSLFHLSCIGLRKQDRCPWPSLISLIRLHFILLTQLAESLCSSSMYVHPFQVPGCSEILRKPKTLSDLRTGENQGMGTESKIQILGTLDGPLVFPAKCRRFPAH